MAYQTDYFSPDGIPDDEPISMCMMSDSDFEIEEEETETNNED